MIHTWSHRIGLLILLFGVSALSYGGNQGSPLLSQAVNGVALAGIPALVLFYFNYPGLYKVIAWALLLSVILLIIESLYLYNQFMYSFFVLKRLVYCGLALSAYYAASQAGPLKIGYVVWVIFGLFFFNQIVLGQLFSYALTSETRTTSAYEAFYLVIPFLYFLVNYLKEHRLTSLFGALITFGLVLFLLHRSVISTVVIGAGVVLGLAMLGKVTVSGLPLGRTALTMVTLFFLAAPLAGLLPTPKVDAFLESIGGIFSPEEDNTGSWRVEQAEHYLGLVPERPLLGWRYEGYDRGEIMENEDFPEKGTIIHSQYVDMLYNYGFVGLGLNLLLILGTLLSMYRRNRLFSTEQLVLFGFIASGLIFGVSYQLPVFYWGFVGVGMFYGLKRPEPPAASDPDEVEEAYSPQSVVFSEN